jgi:hypothetical protein
MDDATAEFYARNAKVVAARYEAAPSSIARYFGVAFAAGSRVLDVGAGSGRDLALLRRGGFEAFGSSPLTCCASKRWIITPNSAGGSASGVLPAIGVCFGGVFDGCCAVPC